ncbi:MAG: transcriptional regulator, partial [Actinomycetota bacterium]
QRRWYELDPGPLAEIASWLEPYRRLWAGQLDRLERHLAATADEAPEEGQPIHE